jgi:hypothetical protein
MPTTVNSTLRTRRHRGRMRLQGERFGYLVVLREVGTHRTAGGTARRVWLCRCDCGNEARVIQQSLLSQDTRSCGCLRRHGRTGPAARASRARWAQYHRERRERQRPIIDEFQKVVRDLIEERALPMELLRLRLSWKAAFDEIFRKRRRIPTDTEAREIALAMNLRGTERERFIAAAREAREKLIAAEVARKRL